MSSFKYDSRRPEYTRRTLGANAPTFRVSLAVVQSLAKPQPVDPAICSVPGGCSRRVIGELATGERRCETHLMSAQALGYGVVFCSWCMTDEDRANQPANRSHGCCPRCSERILADYAAAKAGV